MNSLLTLGFALFASANLVKAQGIVANTPTNLRFGTASGTACLTAASNANNAKVTLEACTNSANQQWTFPIGSGPFSPADAQAVQIFGNKCLDVTNGADANGNKLQIYTCAQGNTNQKWIVNPNSTYSTIQWAGHSKCVDNTGGVTTNGNPTQIWSCINGSANQKWVPEFAGSVLPGGTPTQFSHGSSCLTVLKEENNGPVTIEPCGNIHTSTWLYTGGSLAIGGQCLDVTNGADKDGTLLQVYACTKGNTNQQWKLLSNTSIQWAGHDKCVDLTNGNVAAGQQMQIWSCANGNTNQKWKQTPIFLQ